MRDERHRDRWSARTAAARRPTPRSRRRAQLGLAGRHDRARRRADAETLARSRRRRSPGSRLIAAPRRRAASAARAARRRARSKRVSLEPMMTSVLMSARPGSASPSVVSVDASRRRGRPRGRRRPASSPRLAPRSNAKASWIWSRPRLRGGIVERDDEIALARGVEPALDDRPGLQIVGERDRAEIMAERRAEPRRRRLHRADARQRPRSSSARHAGSPRSTASNTAAAIANTPGSPPETTRDARALAPRAAAPRAARSISTRLSLAWTRWSGRERERARDKGHSRRDRSPRASAALGLRRHPFAPGPGPRPTT